ncbi:HpcH/HpaI aldolase family protein [Nitratireductor soli]|uniref:HpcH/HpaI aldolase family protein n=1 Tax=Nitratireductor soli TaxID=1670619 RepID=UPI00065E6905|nr:HpcH/HpaI aldolase/citrate lyase family protein [Nitratireductor soli]
MTMPENRFKARLLAGETQWGLWSTLASPVAAEALSLVGFDWMLFDTEHSPIEIAGLQPILQAAAVGTASAVARPAWNDKVLIKKLLDIGVQTVLVPFIETPEEAEAAVRATRYPPEGIRGVAGSTRASRYGMASDYLKKANAEICVLVQIETTQAMARLEEIAAVDGVDGVFIGPSDLSASMGHLGNPAHPDVQEAIRAAADRIAAAGKVPGILATKAEDAVRYRDWGYRFVAGAVDVGLLVGSARTLLQTVAAQPKDTRP